MKRNNLHGLGPIDPITYRGCFQKRSNVLRRNVRKKYEESAL